MRLFKRDKIEIKISKLLVATAMADASACAMRTEFQRQTSEQLKGTWLENCRITVVYGFDDHPTPTFTWSEVPAPPTHDITFVWVD